MISSVFQDFLATRGSGAPAQPVNPYVPIGGTPSQGQGLPQYPGQRIGGDGKKKLPINIPGLQPRLPRTDLRGFGAIQGELGRQMLDPRKLYQEGNIALTKRAVNDREAASNVSRRGGYGGAWVAQHLRDSQAADAAARQELILGSQRTAAEANSGILGRIGDLEMGRTQIESGERDQDLMSWANILQYLQGLWGGS